MKLITRYRKKTNPVHTNIYALTWLSRQKSNITLSPKADGIYTELKYKNYIFQAEYIKSIDTYLIFDTLSYPIKHSNTLINRYNWIRDLHLLTKDSSLNQITTIDQLLNALEADTKLLSHYLKTTTDHIKWFPKITLQINMIPSEFLPILDTNMDSSLLYKTDGWIICSLKYIGQLSKQIYKYKPKNELTIDVLYSDNKWWALDNNILHCLNNINNNAFIDLQNMSIYRCIWDDDLQWIPKEIRNDKTNPNSISVINDLEFLHKNYWSATTLPTNCYYYNDVVDKCDSPKGLTIHFNQYYATLLQNQREMFKNIIFDIMLNNIINVNNIIDIGCGKGYLLKTLKDKNITNKNAVLVDIDPSNIFILQNKYYKHNKYKFICADMNNYNLYINDNIYDILILTNSLHYINNLRTFILNINNCRYMYVHFIDGDMLQNNFEYSDIKITKNDDNTFNFCYPWKINMFCENVVSYSNLNEIMVNNNWVQINAYNNDNNEFSKIHKYLIYKNNNI